MSGKNLFFHFARVFFAAAIVAAGYYMYTNGQLTYEKYFHAIRKSILPDVAGSQKIPYTDFTFQQAVPILIQDVGVLFMISGVLIAVNLKWLGAILFLAATLIVMFTKDNPFLYSSNRIIKQEQGLRQFEFIKHLSLVAGAILILVHRY